MSMKARNNRPFVKK